MRKDKEKALSLRKSGKSFKEIEKILIVPRSTLSAWFKSENWSHELSLKLAKKAQQSARIRIIELNKIRGEHLSKLYTQAEQEAKEEFEILKYHPLFLSGLMIYWGEGNKLSKNRCSIANCDPLMIRVFVDFLRKICCFETPKIKAWILFYSDLNEQECKNYWMKNTGLESKDFSKSILIEGKLKKRKLSYGVCSVGVSSAYLKRKILTWIELIGKDLTEEKYNAGMV